MPPRFQSPSHSDKSLASQENRRFYNVQFRLHLSTSAVKRKLCVGPLPNDELLVGAVISV